MDFRMSAVPELSVTDASDLFRALGDETRLRITALLSIGELCVCHLQAALGCSQPKVSRHLGVLRAAGVVEARREGGWVHYRLAQQSDLLRRQQLAALVAAFDRPALRRAHERLRAGAGPGCA